MRTRPEPQSTGPADMVGAVAPLVGGAVVLAACTALARGGTVGTVEERWFRALNRGVGPLEVPVWVLMQFGNGLVALAAPAVGAATGGTRSDAARLGLAGFGGWQLAKGVKRLVPRRRPGALLDEVVLRDGDPSGGGFVSGHATVAMATAVVAAPLVGGAARTALLGAAVGTAMARVHVGAHLPLDVVGGAALGLVWGTVCARVGRGARS